MIKNACKSAPKAGTPKLPLVIPSSRTTSEINKTGTWRYLIPRYAEKTAPCGATCPAGEDISHIEMLLSRGDFKQAWDVILMENPFPGVCGRICYHPCERVCNRKDFDEAVSIRALERFLSDSADRNEFRPSLAPVDSRKEKIAIIGGGPAGLSAAYFLRLLGYACDVFEARPAPGGILRWGLPRYRLPRDVLEKEIERIASLGMRIHCNHPVTRDFFKTISDTYAAAFMACGQWRPPGLHIPGESLSGVSEGLKFLRDIADGSIDGLQGPVAVIGGGNTAVDVARSARRLGAEPVIIYRRRREDMPAFGEEIEMALAEGVELMELCAPIRIEARGDTLRLTLQRMKPVKTEKGTRMRVAPDEGHTQVIETTRVFKAIGFEAAEAWHLPPRKAPDSLKLRHIRIARHPGGAPVAYGGDLTTATKSVVDAVASGKEAAMAIDICMREGLQDVKQSLAEAAVAPGAALSFEKYRNGERARRSSYVVKYQDINIDYFEYTPRLTQPRLLESERVASFGEIDLKISASIAIREAERCFNCGLCNSCDNCRLFCPDLAIKLDEAHPGRRIDYDYCKGCGICVVECPRNAMLLEEEEQKE